MLLYIILFLIPVILYTNETSPYTESKTGLKLYMTLLCLLVGLSDMLGGYDRYIYGALFDNLADNRLAGIPVHQSTIFSLFGHEFGYVWLNWLITFVTANRYIFILLVTIIIYFLLYQTFSRYLNNHFFGMVLFLALWFFFTFTYLRQVLSASVAFLSIRYIINRNFWKFALLMLIAFSLHNSAVIFFPMYFLPIRKFSRKQIFAVMLVCLAFGISSFPNNLFEAYGDVSLDSQNHDYAAYDSFRIAYALETVFFLFFLLKGHEKISEDSESLVFYNIALVFCAILLFFIRSENGGRLSWYYLGGLIITLTNMAVSDYGRQMRMDFILLAVSLILYLRILTGWDILLYPYKSFLTNGVRPNDKTYIEYEYDHQYEVDKFYR